MYLSYSKSSMFHSKRTTDQEKMKKEDGCSIHRHLREMRNSHHEIQQHLSKTLSSPANKLTQVSQLKQY